MAQHTLLDPSSLGNKEYWDAQYDRELANYENDRDEGTVWFSESNAEEAMLREIHKLEKANFLRRNVVSGGNSSQSERNDCTVDLPSSRFLDLGTGNGHLLFELYEDEDDDGNKWSGELVGVDYSVASVELARRIASERFGVDPSSSPSLRFEHWDLLSGPPGEWLKDDFDVVLDKGTFDAISLTQHDAGSRHPCEIYCEKITPLLKPRSFLIITSCNWTRDELVDWLVPNDGELSFFGESKYPTFTFGGQTGQSVVTVIFQRLRG